MNLTFLPLRKYLNSFISPRVANLAPVIKVFSLPPLCINMVPISLLGALNTKGETLYVISLKSFLEPDFSILNDAAKVSFTISAPFLKAIPLGNAPSTGFHTPPLLINNLNNSLSFFLGFLNDGPVLIQAAPPFLEREELKGEADEGPIDPALKGE